MIRDFIYYMPIIISIIGIASIVFVLKNKNRKENKCIVIFNIINILYLFIIPLLIHNMLPIIVDFTILLIWFISIGGAILYIISTIICIIKKKKLDDKKNRISLKVLYLILLIPTIVFTICLCKEIYLINNSEIILSFHSSGNGGLGDSNDFVYVISDKYCTEISLDVGFSYRCYNKMFLSKNIEKADENELNNKGFEIILENRILYIYKNGKLIHNKKLNDRYFNIKLKDVFYNK